MQNQKIIDTLDLLKEENKYIALSLHPESGRNFQNSKNNTFLINEGRDGKFENVTEEFYDSIVYKYDSRCKPRNLNNF